MYKKVFKYFFDSIAGQEKWLNKMSDKGFRLLQATKLMYEFQRCNPSEYEYRVEFVADKSYKELKEYIDFLGGMGLRCLTQNMNINYALGRIKWRPWAKGTGMIATSPGNINKELLIIEKKRDAGTFELHTGLDDLINYYRTIRNAYGYASIVTILLAALGSSSHDIFGLFAMLVKGAVFTLAVFFIFLTIRYSLMIHEYKEKRKIQE